MTRTTPLWATSGKRAGDGGYGGDRVRYAPDADPPGSRNLTLREQQEALTEAERRLKVSGPGNCGAEERMELRKQISNNTIVTALSRQTQRGL